MAAIATLPVVLGTGDHASRPAASAVGSGGLYSCTTHSLVYQTDGSSWSTWATLGGSGGMATDPLWNAAGDLAVGTGSDAGTRLGIGSTGDVLTVAAGTASWAAPASGGGALVLLEQHTATNTATLDFTTFISSTYDEYMIELVNLLFVTDGTDFLMRMGTGAGPTYDTGNNYSYDGFVWRSGASATFGGTAQNHIALDDTGAGIDNGTTTDTLNGSFRIYNLQSANWKPLIGNTEYRNNSANRVAIMLRAAYESTTAVTALRFLAASGNISSGTIRAYGIAK